MPVFLFDKIIFGPVKSRRLGVSLGINLLPLDYKYCNFDCIYCECGRTYKEKFISDKFHSRDQVKKELEMVLIEMKHNNNPPDVITFAGNGEPTIHPDFEGIIDDTIEIRDKYFKNARITVLSNATLIGNKKVFSALRQNVTVKHQQQATADRAASRCGSKPEEGRSSTDRRRRCM